MTIRTSYEHGLFNWVDLNSTDLDRSKAFYAGLFGWELQEAVEPEAGGYTMARVGGHDVAGLGPQPMEGVPSMWNTYVNVDDADVAAKTIEAAGGTVLMPAFDVMGFGRMAVCTDPTGAVFSIWQARSHVGAGRVNEVGCWSWSELMTRDLDAAIAFYTSVFGWEARRSDEYTEWLLDGRSIGGAMATPAEVPAEVPASWTPYFMVEDFEAAAARVTELGGQLLTEPMSMPDVGRFCPIADDVGAVLSIIQATGPVD